ncbi:uncharacterized protein M421DRAFT_416712 [Didymella exigua CBS 183.55]|uniref:Uncharacterized protein n=1 Tax=Didymella exigua CBS 183.55 TaxID=1150837 RepID=A0A6A5RVS7_9PLEO|nr:uncharacterized protein M421DRAFT_416712 [Didymella exigua CBS 183.55]KAF1931982.1 hypothetical protein M421DRAFT_416712 [Didymella exigua CBS 183.55]
MLNSTFSLHVLEEPCLSLNKHLTAANLRLQKSKQLSNISLTWIRKDSRPGCAR